MKKEEFDEALKLALDGGRSEKEATLWAIDYLKRGGKENHNVAADAANIMEAERLMLQAQKEVDNARCVTLRQQLYLEDQPHAKLSCTRDPGQLLKLDETSSQLQCSIAVKSYKLKNRVETYSPEEAEIESRAELGLPKAKANLTSDTVPNLYK